MSSTIFSGGELRGENAKVTLVADAGTLNKSLGRVTTETLTTAAEGVEAFVITSDKVTADSVVACFLRSYTGAGTPLIGQITVADGSFTVELVNSSAATALNAAAEFDFAVLGEIVS